MSKKRINAASLSQKYIIAAAGGFLMLFLVSHLATNLLMIAGDEGATFRTAVEFLMANPVIKVVEYVLFAGFIVHIIAGLIIEYHNRRARPVDYYITPKSDTSAFSRFMIHTGIIIFIFLVVHLGNFFFVKIGLKDSYGGAESAHDFFPMAVYTFQNTGYMILYVISMIFLGFHLKHGFQSAFQSFGFNHNKYFPIIKIIGLAYAIIIAVGFSIIPLYFYFIY
jgi:succinate dehydrogenase / fumarate reductase, cytochrome b subunit